MSQRRLSNSREHIKSIRIEVELKGQKREALLNDTKALKDRIEHLNTRSVGCIESQQYEHALIFLSSAEELLQASSERGHQIDEYSIQCVLQNQACCYQNLWQLQQCSNYVEALIFNLNNRKINQTNRVLARKEESYNRYILAKYYLQFCAVNSQLENHSGGLISARKALTIIRKEFIHWDKYLQSRTKIRNKAEHQEKLRILNILCNFCDKPNLQQSQTILEATSYFLKLHSINLSGSKNCPKDVRYLIQNFTVKNIMQIPSITQQDCLSNFQKEYDMSLFGLAQRVFVLSVCYFTMATELRLIAIEMAKNKDEEDVVNIPQYKQSQIYHLFSILVLVLSINVQSQFLGQLLTTFTKHYGIDLSSYQIQFKKAFTQIIVEPSVKSKELSIICSDQDEGLYSHLSKGSGTMVRFTKSSKESDQNKKFSLLEPNTVEKKSKSKSKKRSKRKQSTSKQKIQSSSLIKEKHLKSPKNKESMLEKQSKSKESIHLKSPLSSLKQLSNPIRQKLTKQTVERQKTCSKSKKRYIKVELTNKNQYFLSRRGDKKHKKTSVSSKKSSIKTKSTGKLPIDSTLEAKDPAAGIKEKKSPKRSLLQHYL